MYGLVNRAIEELAIEVGGYSTWESIKDKAGVDVVVFQSMQPYPDEVTYDLVSAASEVLDIPADQLLRQFGKHWILFTAQEGYGTLLKTAGSNVREFIDTLDSMHARISSAMPELEPPSFSSHDLGSDCFQVRYFSKRDGLAPMVVGLLEGVGEMFSTPLLVTHHDTKQAQGYHTFNVEYSQKLKPVREIG
ncbi:MAG: heme NO-binding domain-containing protein [Halioglobus sp.]